MHMLDSNSSSSNNYWIQWPPATFRNVSFYAVSTQYEKYDSTPTRAQSNTKNKWFNVMSFDAQNWSFSFCPMICWNHKHKPQHTQSGWCMDKMEIDGMFSRLGMGNCIIAWQLRDSNKYAAFDIFAIVKCQSNHNRQPMSLQSKHDPNSVIIIMHTTTAHGGGLAAISTFQWINERIHRETAFHLSSSSLLLQLPMRFLIFALSLPSLLSMSPTWLCR